jgi:hypothetical protein
MSLKANSPWVGIIEFFPARESFASGILAGDVEIANFYYNVLVLVIGFSITDKVNYQYRLRNK